MDFLWQLSVTPAAILLTHLKEKQGEQCYFVQFLENLLGKASWQSLANNPSRLILDGTPVNGTSVNGTPVNGTPVNGREKMALGETMATHFANVRATVSM